VALILILIKRKYKIMRKRKSYNRIVAFSLFLSLLLSVNSYAQQDVIANKNNTRPEITRPFNNPVGITYFSATRQNGYNELQWSSNRENDTWQYVVEYSTDGIYYSSAGVVQAHTGNYKLNHHTFENYAMLYRLRIEGKDGKHVYSRPIMLDGRTHSPVKIYPTIVTGNTVNVISELPIERITVTATDGQQVYIQDVGGKSNYIYVGIPSLGKGIYWMSFIGQGWTSTGKFIIP
jgi:hypothetical protein